MSISEKHVTNDLIANILPSRSVSSRKGQNGTVAIIGGSRHYHGAPILSAAAAMRDGSDLVYLMVPKVISIPVRSFSPNFIVIPLPDDKLTLGCANKIMKWLPDVDSVVLGCGLGIQKTDGLKKLIVDLSSQDINIVLDAGGADIILKDDGTTFGSLTNTGGELVLKSGSTPTVAATFAGDDVSFADDVALASDSAALAFGANSEIKLIHSADTGLLLKHTATGDGTPVSLTLQTGEQALTVGEPLGTINFQAPDESGGSQLKEAPSDALASKNAVKISASASLIFRIRNQS